MQTVKQKFESIAERASEYEDGDLEEMAAVALAAAVAIENMLTSFQSFELVDGFEVRATIENELQATHTALRDFPLLMDIKRDQLQEAKEYDDHIREMSKVARYL